MCYHTHRTQGKQTEEDKSMSENIHENVVELNEEALAEVAGGKSAKYVLAVADANVRSGPGTNYDSVGSANKYDAITIYTQIEFSEGNVWGYVAKGNIKGWMSMQYANMG